MKFVSVRNAVSPLNAAAVTSFCAAVVRRRWSGRNAGESEHVKVAVTHVDPKMRTGRYQSITQNSIGKL